MHRDDDDSSRGNDAPEWSDETHCRVLSQDGSGEGGSVVHCLTEKKLYLIKVRSVPGVGPLSPGHRLSMATDGDDAEISMVLSRDRFRELPNPAKLALVEVVKTILTDNPAPAITFYNRAGPVSLKFHAFQMLPGVGPQKARQMLKSRTSMGWDTFEEVDEACAINSLQLIAERLVEELEDPKLAPSLLTNVIRAAEP